MPGKSLSIVFFTLIGAIFLFSIMLPTTTEASQSSDSSPLKPGKVIKLGEFNESSYRFDSFPQMSFSEPNKVYVLWHNLKEYLDPNSSIYAYDRMAYDQTGIILRVSNDSGNSFGLPSNVRNSSELYFGNFRNLSEYAVVTDPLLASKDDKLYVGWVESYIYDFDIILKRSLDNGSNFEPFGIVSNESRIAQNPSIRAGENNTVFLAWQGYEDNPDNSTSTTLQFKRSDDGAKTFERNTSFRNYSFFKPVIAETGNNVYLAWIDGSNVFLATSDDLGAHFNQPIKFPINETGSKFSSEPAMAASGKNVYVVWSEGGIGGGDIFFGKIIEGGKNMDSVVKITNLTQFCESATQPDISARRDEVYLVWQGTSCRPGSALFLTQSVDGGKTFSNSTNLTNFTFASGGSCIACSVVSNAPKIVTSNKDIFLVWENKYNFHGDIMFSKLE